MKTNNYVAWSDDGRRVALSNIDLVATLLTASIIVFGDKTVKACEPGKLTKHEWIKDTVTDRTVDLSHIGQENVTLTTEFDGCVFYVEGDDLRLRSRAYAHHNGESFPADNLPSGEMQLFVDAMQKSLAYKHILDIIHKRA